MPETATKPRATGAGKPGITARSVTVRAETVDERKRTVDATLATSAPTPVFDMDRLEVIDEVLVMDGVRSPDQMPLLSEHRVRIDHMVGSVRRLRSQGERLIGTLHFAEGQDGSPEERAWELVKQGHLDSVSIGYRAENYVDIPAGESQRVNGRQWTAGGRTLRITTEWTPVEGSLVPIGADDNARIRAAALESIGVQRDEQHDGDQSMSQPATTANAETGSALRSALNAQIEDEVTEHRQREQVIQDMADAVGIETSEVERVLNGDAETPSAERLSAFAAVLDIDEAILTDAAQEA